MNSTDINPVSMARRHWRSLIPAWLTPLAVMLAAVIEDVSHFSFMPPVFALLLLPVVAIGTLSAIRLQRRERLPWGVFYLIWLAPAGVIWCSLVFIRAGILILLGRPL